MPCNASISLIKGMFIFYLLFHLSQLTAQTKHHVNGYIKNGYIKDAESGESLIGVTVFVSETTVGTVTNDYGFYSIVVDSSATSLNVSFIGYKPKTIDLSKTNQTINISLERHSSMLDEIVVTSQSDNTTNLSKSAQKISMLTMKKIPALLGEVDIIRSIQLLPGVSSVGEGASGFNVRGGSIDQNLVLLDEAPVYNSSHAFGFFSAFNPDIIKDVKLYKGGIPAEYGGRLSSVLDVRMKEGNNQKLAVKGGLGLIFSRIAIEAPIVKNKASFIVAGRRSYADLLFTPFLKGDFSGTTLNFHDLTLKTNFHIGTKDHLFVSGYIGNDNFKFRDQAGFSWGNALVSTRWNHLFSERLFSNLTLFRSDYSYNIDYGEEEDNSIKWNAQITNYAAKPRLSYYINENNLLTFGGESIYSIFSPGNAVGSSEGESRNINLKKKFSLEGAAYLKNEQKIGEKVSIDYGIRLSAFSYIGKTKHYYNDNNAIGVRKIFVQAESSEKIRIIQSYFNLAPRFSFNYKPRPSIRINVGYNKTTQYVHLISNGIASTPLDVWTPSTNNIKPQLADQISIGYFQDLTKAKLSVSVEAYFKAIHRLTEYIEGANLFLNEYLEGELLTGKGRAYGIELQIEKKQGDFTGWLSYTYSRTERRAEGINRSKWFPTRFDQPHNLSITGLYEINKRLSCSANFIFNSGSPTTFPTSRVEQQEYVIPYNVNQSRNNVRLPYYHRLDLSITLKGKPNKRFQNEWVFGAYNLYSRRNPFTIFFRQDQLRMPENPTTTEVVRLSILGSIIPSVSWNFKF